MRTSRAGDARPDGRRGQAGLTLVELIVVLGLIAIIATLAVPQLGAVTPRLELRQAAEELRAGMRSARGAALRENRETTFTIDVDSGVWRDDATGRTGQTPEGATIDLLVAQTERVDPSAARIRFNPDGSSTGGRATLRRGGVAFEVEADWFDGSVTVREAPDSQ